jgi:2-phosphosulfolactate phosphatase
MNVSILSCFEGAEKARGTAIIFDVFRASNTIIACIAKGAKTLKPVSTLEEAYALKKENPGSYLIGERKGLMPKGFDYNNSPYLISHTNLEGKDIIFTSSAGAKGIVSASKADELLIGSFSNITALCRYVKTKSPKKVSLIAIGLEGNEKAIEDEEFAI